MTRPPNVVIAQSAWAPWLRDARLALGDPPRTVFTLTASTEVGAAGGAGTAVADVDALLVPAETPAGFRLGGRAGPDRRKQARALLALAAFGWCGPWPDPDADPEHVRLLREAIYAVDLGPADARGPLFAAGGPLPGVAVRQTDGARHRLATVGLAETPARCEVVAEGRGVAATLRVLRAAALWCAEHGGRMPATLDLGPLRLAARATPLPLPHATCVLWWVRGIAA